MSPTSRRRPVLVPGRAASRRVVELLVAGTRSPRAAKRLARAWALADTLDLASTPDARGTGGPHFGPPAGPERGEERDPDG